jgi:hypothetical protein
MDYAIPRKGRISLKSLAFTTGTPACSNASRDDSLLGLNPIKRLPSTYIERSISESPTKIHYSAVNPFMARIF